MLTLRPYQTQFVENVESHWANGILRIVGVLPTGAGKTESALGIILRDASPTHRILVVVERKVLCHQWAKRIRSNSDKRVGILQGENTIALSASILVATAQTIAARGIPSGVGTIVIDECHLWHKTHDKILESAPDARALGLTATPLRKGLGLRFESVVVGITIRELIEMKYLVKPRYFAPDADAMEKALSQVAIRSGEFASEQLSTAMRGKVIVGDTVGNWLENGQDRQTIAFCVDKAHAADLAGEFVSEGIKAEVIVDTTDDDDRARMFADFECGKTRVLCSVGVLAIGFDSPIASCAIFARPTLSTALYIQQGGRVLRTCDGKVDALIFDHAGNVLRHGKLEDFIPPDTLSEMDETPDKKSRREASDHWVCKSCEAINDRSEPVCVECGEPRQRHTILCVLDGKLQPIDENSRPTDAPTPDEIKQFYVEALWYATRKGMKNAPGWTWHKTVERFKLTPNVARTVIAWNWRDLPPISTSPEVARWLINDYKRSKVVERYRTRLAANG